MFHVVYFLDLYLGDSFDDFQPPPEFAHERGKRPATPFTKEQLRRYLDDARSRWRDTIAGLAGGDAADENTLAPFRFPWGDEMSRTELVLYNLRHIQHHAAQLNLLLRQAIDFAPDWVVTAED